MSGRAAGRLFWSMAIDLNSARLVKACQGLKYSKLVDWDLGAELVRRAQSVRAFLEAGEEGAARTILGQLTAYDFSSEDAHGEAAKGIVERRVKALVMSLPPLPK